MAEPPVVVVWFPIIPEKLSGDKWFCGRCGVGIKAKKKAIELLQRAGNPIPGALNTLNGYVHSITDENFPVKRRLRSVTESQTKFSRRLSEVEEKFSRHAYWKPDLTKAEWSLLNRTLDKELLSSENYLDDRTKWAYAKEKGTEVFAIYGIGDGTEATVLYASGKKTAFVDYSMVTNTKESVAHNAYRTSRSCYRLLTGLRRKNGRNLPDDSSSERRRSTVGDSGLPGTEVREPTGFGDDHAEGSGDSGDLVESDTEKDLIVFRKKEP